MKRLIYGATMAALVAVSAQAQTQTQTQPQTPTPANPAVNPTAVPSGRSAPDAGAPLPGANSFTESQAKTRIEQLGYTNVTGLAKDSDGVWRGTAMKDSRTHNVGIDFRGNIVVGQK